MGNIEDNDELIFNNITDGAESIKQGQTGRKTKRQKEKSQDGWCVIICIWKYDVEPKPITFK